YSRHTHLPPSFPTRRSSDLGWVVNSSTTQPPNHPTTQPPNYANHAAPLPGLARDVSPALRRRLAGRPHRPGQSAAAQAVLVAVRSEEHTSELQSRFDLVCRL